MNGVMAFVRTGMDLGGRLPGIVVATILALAAAWIAGGLGDPLARNPVLVAMLFGLLLGSIFGCPALLLPGLNFTKRYLLRLGVMLLGFRITVSLLGDLGMMPITIAAIELIIVVLVVRWVAVRVFKLDRDLALLVAVGASVCGAAAILSVASQRRSREQHAGLAIALITIGGTIALLLYPIGFLAGWIPGLDDRGFGIMVGSSIFELAQVYGASYAVSEGALNTATLVKLSKVVMLIPLLIVMGLIQSRACGSDAAERRCIPIPWFVVGFVCVLLFNSAYTVHPEVRKAILDSNQFLFLMVMIALGLTTPLTRLCDRAGAMRLIGTGVFALALSASVAYALVRMALGAPSESAASTGIPMTEMLAAEPGQLPPSIAEGRRLFNEVGCAKCHVPSMRGIAGDVWLYSDLLLHDMGPSLDDKIVQGSATGADWRTTPLVGLRTRERYLHDGRAATFRDAILAHGGEAEVVRKRLLELNEADQQTVYMFLSSL
jgi:uncharacterized integral membrane protein (TIGR00698 family)